MEIYCLYTIKRKIVESEYQFEYVFCLAWKLRVWEFLYAMKKSHHRLHKNYPSDIHPVLGSTTKIK